MFWVVCGGAKFWQAVIVYLYALPLVILDCILGMEESTACLGFSTSCSLGIVYKLVYRGSELSLDYVAESASITLPSMTTIVCEFTIESEQVAPKTTNWLVRVFLRWIELWSLHDVARCRYMLSPLSALYLICSEIIDLRLDFPSADHSFASSLLARLSYVSWHLFLSLCFKVISVSLNCMLVGA